MDDITNLQLLEEIKKLLAPKHSKRHVAKLFFNGVVITVSSYIVVNSLSNRIIKNVKKANSGENNESK